MVDAGPDYNIPKGTPFALTATGRDPDGDAVTFCWEEYDLGPPSPPSDDDGARPLFRSFPPASSPSRTFPRLADILNNTSSFGETLPVTPQSMRFRVTGRDPRGGASSAAMQVRVSTESGPFAVTTPGAAQSWAVGSTESVTWEVANTSGQPINCENVRILLSTDGGNSFPIVLADKTPNDGSESVTVPYAPTAAARVKVEALGNIFFDISNADFVIARSIARRPVALRRGRPVRKVQ